MSPLPNGPGPARSQSAAIRFAVEGGKPRRLGASPAVSAISRCASAKRVSESTSSSTCRPWSRKTSAIAIAIQAARRLISGAWSEVAATTTARCHALRAQAHCRRSRAARARARRSARRPRCRPRCRARGRRAATTCRRPTRRRRRCAGRARAAGWCRRPRARCRAAARAPCASPAAAAPGAACALAAPGVSGRPSSGWPKASTIRPTQLSAGCTPAGPEQRRRVADRRAVERRIGHRPRQRLRDRRRPRRPARRRRRARSPPGRRSAHGSTARRSPAPPCPTAVTRPTRRWFATRASSAPSAAKSVSMPSTLSGSLPFANHQPLSPR